MAKNIIYIVTGMLLFIGLITIATGVLMAVLNWDLDYGFTKFKGSILIYLGLVFVVLGGLLGIIQMIREKRNKINR